MLTCFVVFLTPLYTFHKSPGPALAIWLRTSKSRDKGFPGNTLVTAVFNLLNTSILLYTQPDTASSRKENHRIKIINKQCSTYKISLAVRNWWPRSLWFPFKCKVWGAVTNSKMDLIINLILLNYIQCLHVFILIETITLRLYYKHKLLVSHQS